jgi:hypothetical protein
MKGILLNKHGWVIEYSTYSGPGKKSNRTVDLHEDNKKDSRLLELEGTEVNFEMLKINPMGRAVDPMDMTQNQSQCKWVAKLELEEILISDNDKKETSAEYIICAAIWYKEIPLKKIIDGVLPKNCDRGLVVLGHRHGQCMWTMGSLTGLRSVANAEDGVGEYEQGFLTNTNRFVDRKEGGEIAFSAGQTSELKKTLYSEDIY